MEWGGGEYEEGVDGGRGYVLRRGMVGYIRYGYTFLSVWCGCTRRSWLYDWVHLSPLASLYIFGPNTLFSHQKFVAFSLVAWVAWGVGHLDTDIKHQL